MLLLIFLALLAARSVQSQSMTTAAPFVSGPVSCTAVAVQFTINPDNLSYKKLTVYSVFVGVFADHAKLDCSEKPVAILNELVGDVAVSIGFSECNITIDALYGAQQQLLEYGATIYARLSPIELNDDGTYGLNASFPNLTFPITCAWRTGAQISNNASITNDDPQPPPPVGNTTTPIEQLNMTLTNEGGTVEAGTRIRVVLRLNPGSFYNSELPEYCSVGNAANPTTGTFIAVIANFCPYLNTINNSPFNFKAYKEDNNTYFFDFDAFVYNNQPTTLYVTCYIQVCLNVAECTRDCWPPGTTNERFIEAISGKSRYQQTLIQFNDNTPPTAADHRQGKFNVVPRSSTGTTAVPAGNNGLPDWALIVIILFIGFLLLSLLLCFCCCVCCGFGLGLWSRRREKQHEHRREYIYPHPASMPPSYPSDISSFAHMEIPKVNLNSSSSSARSITSDKSYKY